MTQETDIHVARQPIFDCNQDVFGYELLFRSNVVNAYDGIDGDHATHSVISNSFLLLGIESITDGKKAFINFTANSLKNNIPAILPKELLAVEILEDVAPDEEIINACKNLKEAGYLIVLDDFMYTKEYMPLIRLADIIKVDFLATPRQERLEVVKRLKNYPIKFLAEKVESQEEFKEALRMGYSYFQGYFFSKPIIMSGKNLPEYKANHLQILQELNRPELEFRQIEEIIKKDVSLSYKLLKFINSPLFGLRSNIESLRQALTLLGTKELIKWLSLITLKGIASDKPGELILESLIRARFCEMLAAGIMPKQYQSNAFLMGMFSYIDVLLDRSLQDILAEIPLADEIKNALLEKEHNQFYYLYKLIQNYEKGDWETCFDYAKQLKIDEKNILNACRASLIWAHELLVNSD